MVPHKTLFEKRVLILKNVFKIFIASDHDSAHLSEMLNTALRLGLKRIMLFFLPFRSVI